MFGHQSNVFWKCIIIITVHRSTNAKYLRGNLYVVKLVNNKTCLSLQGHFTILPYRAKICEKILNSDYYKGANKASDRVCSLQSASQQDILTCMALPKTDKTCETLEHVIQAYQCNLRETFKPPCLIIITVHNTCVIGGSEFNMQQKDNS